MGDPGVGIIEQAPGCSARLLVIGLGELQVLDQDRGIAFVFVGGSPVGGPGRGGDSLCHRTHQTCDQAAIVRARMAEVRSDAAQLAETLMVNPDLGHTVAIGQHADRVAGLMADQVGVVGHRTSRHRLGCWGIPAIGLSSAATRSRYCSSSRRSRAAS